MLRASPLRALRRAARRRPPCRRLSALPATMSAVAIETRAGAPLLEMAEIRAAGEDVTLALRPGVPLPEPGPGEVLIKVEYAGVNRPDCVQRKGLYPPPPGASPVLGLEVSGTVVQLGAEAGGSVQVGDRVCALVAGGGYAEYAAAPASCCLPVPEGMGLLEAAALPETFFTVWTNVFQRGVKQGAELQPGESILIHGGTSGIGTTAIQLASSMGSTVYATAGSDDKCAACVSLGATAAINYREEDYVARVKELQGGRGVDVILDMVGGDYLAKNLSLLNRRGRHVSIAFLRGSKVPEGFDFGRLLVNNLTLSASTLRPRAVSRAIRPDHCRCLLLRLIVARPRLHFPPKIMGNDRANRWRRRRSSHRSCCRRSGRCWRAAAGRGRWRR